jgi:hypothetical protein
MAELVPADLAAIDDEQREVTVLAFVRFDPATHNPLIRNLEAAVAVLEMFYLQGPAHLLDQSPKQNEWIFPGIPNDLKKITGRIPIAKLKRIERDAGHQQPGAKMELVNFSVAITYSDRFERGVLKAFHPGCLCHLSVEAATAERPVSIFG